MAKWRIARNKWNVKDPPWRGAIGIEEDDEVLAVPSLVCWFTRGGWSMKMIQDVVDSHNERETR